MVEVKIRETPYGTGRIFFFGRLRFLGSPSLNLNIPGNKFLSTLSANPPPPHPNSRTTWDSNWDLVIL